MMIFTSRAVAMLSLLLITCPFACAQQMPLTKPQEAGFVPERLAGLDRQLQTCMEEGCLPGAVALIARHGKIAYLKSFGMADLESGKPMHTDAIFRIASMTKPITSVAVMMLYEEGRFLLNDPVSKYIPEFKKPQVLVEFHARDTTCTTVPAKKEISIRDLLTHSSGIGYGLSSEALRCIYRKADVPDAYDIRGIALAEKIRALAGLPLVHHPGEGFTYGLGTDVLGYLIEVISGKPLDRFLEERLFKPLKMRDTYFYLPDEKAARLVTLYRYNGTSYERYTQEKMQEVFPHSSPDYPLSGSRTYFSGGSGLVSTAPDYARFLQMLLNGGSLAGVRILSPKSVELMTADHVAWSKGQFGLGFAVTTALRQTGELGSLGSYSWAGLWNTSFWVDPQEDLIGVFMSQADPAVYNTVRFRVQVYQALADSHGKMVKNKTFDK